MLKSYFYCSIIPLGLDLTICFKNNKSNDNKSKSSRNNNYFHYRFDQSTVELLLWYEAIFGKDMWKHVVAETTFWSHSLEAVSQRWQERGQVSSSLLSTLET